VIEGGWGYIWAAYALALGAIGVLTAVVLARLRTWTARARDLDKLK
jgi:hypothetical protein